MPPFTHFVGIDWSGAKGARHKGLAVAVCADGMEAPTLVLPPSGHAHWSRIECGRWIASHCGLPKRARILVGIDAAFGMPFIDEDAYIPDTTLAKTAPQLWPIIAAICEDSEDYFGGPFVSAYAAHYQQQGGRKGSAYKRRMRITETFCRDAKIGPCESVFNLVGASQVGKSALSTMNMLAALTNSLRVAIWPFDDAANAPVCLVEIYAAVFAQLGLHRGKMNTPDVLNAVLSNLRSEAYHGPLPTKIDDAADALVTAAGLRRIVHDGNYWHPSQLSTMVRRTEGWIFGVK